MLSMAPGLTRADGSRRVNSPALTCPSSINAFSRVRDCAGNASAKSRSSLCAAKESSTVTVKVCAAPEKSSASGSSSKSVMFPAMSEPLTQNAIPGQPPGSQPPAGQGLAKTHPILLMVTIGLGVAIILVLALMVGMIVKRATAKPELGNPTATALKAPTPAPGDTAFNTLNVREGTSIADARIEGGFLVLRTTSDMADEVMTFDPKTGQLLARITLKKTDQP